MRLPWVFVGLDVHKKTIHAAVWMNGALMDHWVMPAIYEQVVASIEPLRPGLREVVYEAGPTGYGLARALCRARLPVHVAAPSKTPRPSGDGAKSDRLDCTTLAEYAAKGLLKHVAIPTVEQEADRQVVRLRNQVVCKRRRIKHQIRSFLLQHSLAEPSGLEHWTRAGVQALRVMPLSLNLRFVLDMLLEELDQVGARLRRIEAELQRLAQSQRHAKEVQILQTHPGVGKVVAMEFATEVFQPERFHNTKELGCYVGLAPRIRQSGQTRRDGPTIKAGRERLRSLLVEASWSWIGHDAHAKAVYYRLMRNTGSSQKAIVGMARRMAGNLWTMLRRQEVYRVSA
jgi:transposase